MATCYRHSNRETGVSCSNCGNPICPDCMTPTPVGMRCPECAHIAFNMYLLWILGQMLEPALGPVRFGALYLTSLLAGSFGALLVNPNVPTVGASGAVFGLMGAAFVELRARGIDPFRAGIGGLIVFNLILSFAFSNISVGGHIGGLVGGVLATLALRAGDRMRSRAVGLVGCAALSVFAVVAGIAAA